MLPSLLVSLLSLAFFPLSSLNQLLPDCEKFICLLHALGVDLRRSFLHVFQKSHALAQLFLHSVALLLETLRLVLQLLQPTFHIVSLLVEASLAFFAFFGLAGEFLDKLANLGLVFGAEVG